MKNKLLILLVGQSNMSGRGYLTQEDITEIPGLTAIRRDFKWIPAVDPFNYDRLDCLGLVDSRDPFEEKKRILLPNTSFCRIFPCRKIFKHTLI